jgi:hypothetical protein
MRVSRRFSPRISFHVPRVSAGALASVLLYISIVCPVDSASAQGWNQGALDPAASDRATAARVLGSQWEQMSQRAGLIFVGTVVGANPPSVGVDQLSLVSSTTPAMLPTIQVTFRVDRAIAGTETGQILTIHGWAGASSAPRPMNTGQHVLLFLYAPSRLGFTSPVGGAAGEVLLDATGKYVPAPTSVANFRSLNTSESSAPKTSSHPAVRSGSVLQLERAIRSAREMRDK